MRLITNFFFSLSLLIAFEKKAQDIKAQAMSKLHWNLKYLYGCQKNKSERRNIRYGKGYYTNRNFGWWSYKCYIDVPALGFHSRRDQKQKEKEREMKHENSLLFT